MNHMLFFSFSNSDSNAIFVFLIWPWNPPHSMIYANLGEELPYHQVYLSSYFFCKTESLQKLPFRFPLNSSSSMISDNLFTPLFTILTSFLSGRTRCSLSDILGCKELLISVSSLIWIKSLYLNHSTPLRTWSTVNSELFTRSDSVTQSASTNLSTLRSFFSMGCNDEIDIFDLSSNFGISLPATSSLSNI